MRMKSLKVVFWFLSEHASMPLKAFTEIAGLLGLKGTNSSKGHDQNGLLVCNDCKNTDETTSSK